jgi:formylglycine-generating enzyme required for sulfatase activity
LVTQEAYQRVTGTNPSHFKGPKLPVETVRWNEAQGYCAAVGMRLPTEAEWEYAARASDATARYGAIGDVAWYSGNSGGKTHDVGQKQANAFGLFDMLGNVWEWVADGYGTYQAGNATDPQVPSSGQYRALRGGSWYYGPRGVRASVRSRGGPEDRNGLIGFRGAGE